MTSLPLAERDLFWVGQVRSMTPGLAFRFRAFISVIWLSMLSLIRAPSVLSLEARKLVPGPSCSPSAAVRTEDWTDLVVGHDKLCEEVDGSCIPGWIKDKEATLPVFLDFVSDHRPGMSRVLEDHWHRFCDSHCPTQYTVYGPSASLVRRKVVRDPSHHLLSSGICGWSGGRWYDSPRNAPVSSE